MSDNFKIHKFIEIESGVSEIRTRIGIKNVEHELINSIWSMWNDDVGCKVGEVLSTFSSDFFKSYPDFESKVKGALEAKESDLEKISSITKSKLYEFVENVKEYDVDPSLYK